MLPLTISATVDAVKRVRPSIIARKKGVISNPVPSAICQDPGASITPSPFQSLTYSGHEIPFERAIPAAIAKAPIQMLNLFRRPDSESSICSEFIPSSSTLLIIESAYTSSASPNAASVPPPFVETKGTRKTRKTTAATISNKSEANASNLHPNALNGLLTCSTGLLGREMIRGSIRSLKRKPALRVARATNPMTSLG